MIEWRLFDHLSVTPQQGGGSPGNASFASAGDVRGQEGKSGFAAALAANRVVFVFPFGCALLPQHVVAGANEQIDVLRRDAGRCVREVQVVADVDPETSGAA